MLKTFPITVGFDNSRVIGRIEIEEEYLHLFPKNTLAPSIVDGELRGISLVKTADYIYVCNKGEITKKNKE